MNTEKKRTLHLVCNAHLDPVWLWEWEEGAAAAISTFRTAADLCEEFDGFIFNHNEVILYRWVEEYEPELFSRIQRLVKAGKWHIMGGWYLQPDCNMPSGESLVRQALLGRRYFAEKFGVRPTTAINFDPFGHSRGLVQILVKSGYDSYLICRPDQSWLPLDRDEFIWEGYDGSRVMVSRRGEGYLSPLGKANEKVERMLPKLAQDIDPLLLWGVGNHGGGPSRKDLRLLAEMMAARQDIQIRHSIPEAFFASLKEQAEILPVVRRDLNPHGVGCYTSQVRVKQHHRQLENELYAVEKMASAAWLRAGMAYPQNELQEAMRDLATSEFHDILPGSSIQPAEEMALRLTDHGLELLSRVKARAFFALAQGQPPSKEGEIPVLVYNPHPYPITHTVECEFQMADQNWQPTFTQVKVFRGGQPVPCQVEKEVSNLNLDWRKRVVFTAVLAPAQMNRFDCRLESLPAKPALALHETDGVIHFETCDLDVLINTRTGLVDRYRVGGVDYLEKNACCPLVVYDDADPWAMREHSFRKVLGAFHLLSAAEGQRFSGVHNPALPSVRVIEDGDVRSVVEVVLGWGDSMVCQRYKLPKKGTEVEVEVRVHWNERDRMLKLSLPTPFKSASLLGQVVFGMEELFANGDEMVAQKWCGLKGQGPDGMLTVVNDGSYGLDALGGELRLSLMRSPAYSCHPINDRPYLPDDRYSPRIDQGERLFHFWLNAGPSLERLADVGREALAHNEKPTALSFFPHGGQPQTGPLLSVEGDAVVVSAIKKAEEGSDLIVRLFEPTGQPHSALVSLPFFRMDKQVDLGGFEVRTYRLNLESRTWREVNLMEEDL